MKEYAEKSRLNLIHEFQLNESSTKQTRKESSLIIGIITKLKECIALVGDTVDRLQRSFKESVEFLDLLKQGKIVLHVVRERLILNKNSNSFDLMRWDMNVIMAQFYVLQLADNVKRRVNELKYYGN